jgi:hypothetical protein
MTTEFYADVNSSFSIITGLTLEPDEMTGYGLLQFWNDGSPLTFTAWYIVNYFILYPSKTTIILPLSRRS